MFDAEIIMKFLSWSRYLYLKRHRRITPLQTEKQAKYQSVNTWWFFAWDMEKISEHGR